jgi:hypothetical protein
MISQSNYGIIMAQGSRCCGDEGAEGEEAWISRAGAAEDGSAGAQEGVRGGERRVLAAPPAGRARTRRAAAGLHPDR